MVLATKSLALALVLAAAGAAPAIAMGGGLLAMGSGNVSLDGLRGKATTQGDELPAGLHVEPTLDLEGAPEDFRARLDAGALMNESGAMLQPELRTELTDEQAHVNTHLVASHEDNRAGAYSGVDVYTPKDGPPRVEVHETQNLAGAADAGLDTHVGAELPDVQG
jgi:hypothetical protein